MTHPKGSLHFIFVRTQFASNLGTSVRALCNMGFENVVLVQPECEVGVEARTRAMKGAALLDRARYFTDLKQAAAEIPVLAAATAQRRRPVPFSCRAFVENVLPDLLKEPVGIVFGPENNGLSNEEWKWCTHALTIPAGAYASMNLSQAVAIVAYELRQTHAVEGKPGA